MTAALHPCPRAGGVPCSLEPGSPGCCVGADGAVIVDTVDSVSHTGSMTASMTADTLVEQSPRRTRSRVLFEDFETTANTVRESPGKWFLVGGGERDRYGTFSQTAHRIRRGQIAAFASPEGGIWEAVVSTDKNITDRQHPVEVYLRFVPVKAS